MKQLYFNEYNLLMGSGGIVYLPFVSGILSAYVKTSKVFRGNFEIMPFLFRPDSAENIFAKYRNPSIAAFSISMWNEQLSLEVASRVKEAFPECLIVFGGAQCPHDPTEYMDKYPFIDVCIRAEGEDAFLKLVERVAMDCVDFAGIPNLAWRVGRQVNINYEKPPNDRTLDLFPSPYLTGEFDYLLNHDNHGYQAIVETNRGCPFLCTFCYWGRGGNNTKYRFRSLETVFGELEYLSSKKVEYIFNADSNFGMHKRDYEIALKLVELKKKNGYPEKFRTCWGKNTSERIFKIASLLQLYALDKGVTLARQSNSEIVLSNIKRENIKLESYEFLERNFNTLQVPIYAELILGLPGETYESWKSGIDQMLNAGLNNQLFIYMAEVYPNTELGSPDYQHKFSIKTTRIKLNEIHCSPRELGWTDEYQHIVTSTYSFNTRDWKTMTKFSAMVMLLHSMKVGIYLLAYLHKECGAKYSNLIEAILHAKTPFIGRICKYIENYADSLLAGGGRGLLFPEYSDVYLEVEEVSFLMISENRDTFYNEMRDVLLEFVPNNLKGQYLEVVRFQKYLMPVYGLVPHQEYCEFDHNIPEYCYSVFTNRIEKIEMKQSVININIDQFSTKHEFAKKKMIWARKSGTILYTTDLENKLRNEIKVNYDIENFSNEKTFKISLFSENRKKFDKFDSL